MSYTVGKIARIASVTVRTLHHYDDTGLLRPSQRLGSGYRSYSDDDLERLQTILCYRQLGFPLDEIRTLLDSPDIDPLELLRRQRLLLVQRVDELQQMVATVEKLMEARAMGINLDPKDYLEVFGDSDHAKYHEEAEQRWGETEPWKESQRRAASYTKADWKRIQAEQAALEQELAAALERWFYSCGYEMHRELGDLYVNDPRFEAHYTKVAPGLAAYLRDAIYANAARHES